MYIETLPVSVYLSPHPLDEEGDFEVDWIEDMPGFKKDCEDTQRLVR